ncbi:hypothetical protein M959_08662, partial [Chaetura pelagica]
ASLDVKDMFFQIPVDSVDQKYFAFTWGGVQYTFTRLPQGYKQSPILAHHTLACELEIIPEIKNKPNVKVYQYTDDILIGGQSEKEVKAVYDAIIKHLTDMHVEIPEEKRQSPSQEAKFLGIKWKGGTWNISSDTLSHLKEIKKNKNKKELQEILRTLQYWRKHILDLSIIARPLFDLLKKNHHWEWHKSHDEALELLLVLEAQTFQTLGPLHPEDP